MTQMIFPRNESWVAWLPYEIEALSVAAAIKHFSPFIIQSTEQPCLLTHSKPFVQAFEKLCRGEFSASPRVTSFLSTVSRCQVNIRHLAGSSNVPSDFASRNAPECKQPRSQVASSFSPKTLLFVLDIRGWQQWKLGVLGRAPPDNFKIYNPRNTISSVLGSDILQKSALQIRSLGTSRSGLN